MSELKIDITQNEFSRYAEIGRRNVTVSQIVSAVDFTLKPVRFAWSSPFKPTLAGAELHLEAMREAIKIGKEWEKDTGKDYREVFSK